MEIGIITLETSVIMTEDEIINLAHNEKCRCLNCSKCGENKFYTVFMIIPIL